MIVRYENSGKESITLSAQGIKLREADFFSYEWEVEDGYFTKDERKYQVTIEITGNRQEKKTQLNRFFELTEGDLLKRTPGKLYLDDQYINGYVISAESYPGDSPVGVIKEFTLYTRTSYWIKETPYSFGIGEDYSGNNKRYSYRYAYRYANGLTGTYIINDHFDQADFRMVIYGPVVNPLVIIGGHRYLVNILLEAGEYLEIDSEAGTVYKVMNSGQIVNAFHNRDKENNIFQPILPGRRTVEWSGEFAWDITLYAKRSEPLWQ